MRLTANKPLVAYLEMNGLTNSTFFKKLLIVNWRLRKINTEAFYNWHQAEQLLSAG